MKICRVTRAFVPLRDGISHHTYYLSKHQAALGHNVFVFQPHHPSGISDGIHIINIPLGSLTKRYGSKYVTSLFALRASLGIRQLHRQSKVDIIHGHGDIIETFILKLVAHQLGVPLVMTMHSGVSRRRSYQVIAPFIWRMVDQIITVSPEIAMTMREWGVSPERLHVISSGIESRLFAHAYIQREQARRALNIPGDTFMIVSVGRLHPMKGFRYLIEAASMLSNEHLRVYIVGGGKLESELRSSTVGIPCVALVGSQPHKRILTYLSAADLFVLPSVDLPGQTEGTPTALMEAMAAGLPVVITDSGGGKYLVRHGENGLVVPQKDAAALAGAIRKLLYNPGLREKMAETNRRIAKTKDWRLIAAQVIEVYREASACSTRGA